MISHGQALRYPGGSLSVNGFDSADAALWCAVKLVKQPVRVLRRILTRDQRARVIEMARKKLFS